MSAKLLFLHQILLRVLFDRVVLVVVSSLSSLGVYHAIPLWLVDFPLRNQLEITSWDFSCVLFVLSLVFLNILNLSLLALLLDHFLSYSPTDFQKHLPDFNLPFLALNLCYLLTHSPLLISGALSFLDLNAF